MQRMIRILLVVGMVATLLGGNAAAEPESRVLVGSPWQKDDTVGDAFRPQGDLRKVTIENGGQNIRFTFRMVQAPIWDTISTSRATVMRFLIDWRGTTAPHDRRVTASRADGGWHVVVFNGSGGAACIGGGVQTLSNHRYRFSVPVSMCLGGPRVVRVGSSFADDQADDASDDIKLDKVPNGAPYGPFIRLPGNTRDHGGADADGWIAV